jgi:hypothetical protein
LTTKEAENDVLLSRKCEGSQTEKEKNKMTQSRGIWRKAFALAGAGGLGEQLLAISTTSSRGALTRRGQQDDLILALNGYHPVSDYLRALTPGGGSPRTRVLSMVQKHEDLIFLRGLLQSGQINPVIDRCYPLCRTDEAMQYFEETHARGKVVITVEHRGGKE